jgi:hypothetical protein
MKSLLLGAAVLIALTGAASAQAVLNVKDASGATVPIAAHNGGGVNLWVNQSICDPLVYNQCATVDSSGRLTFNLVGSPTVTVTGGASAANQQATMGPVAPGTVAANSQLTGCQYNSSAPSPSPTQQIGTQCDNQGNVKVNIAQVTGITEGSTTPGQTGALIMQTVIASPQAFTPGTSHIPGMNPNGDTRADQMVTQGNAGAVAIAHICGQHVTINPVSATDTSLVAPVSGKQVYVCDYAISTGAADNLFLESVTTAPCTGTVAQMDTKWFMPVNGAKTDANPYWRGLVTAVGSGICLNTSTAGPASFTLYFDQY